MPPKGTAGLALSWVRGISLSPLPPAMINTSVSFMLLLQVCGKHAWMSREKPVADTLDCKYLFYFKATTGAAMRLTE